MSTLPAHPAHRSCRSPRAVAAHLDVRCACCSAPPCCAADARLGSACHDCCRRRCHRDDESLRRRAGQAAQGVSQLWRECCGRRARRWPGSLCPPTPSPKSNPSLGAKTLAVPFAYAVARTTDGQSVVVAGTDFEQARQLNHWWSVTAWPDGASRGKRWSACAQLAVVSSVAGQPFDLTSKARPSI